MNPIEEFLKTLASNKIVIKMFADYGMPISAIYNIDFEFVNLNVSAKTKNKKIYLDRSLLEVKNFDEQVHYLVHEMCHYLQQVTGKIASDQEHEDYLDKKSEVEAFSRQIDFMNEVYGPEHGFGYAESLLDFHKFKGKERENKLKELLGPSEED